MLTDQQREFLSKMLSVNDSYQNAVFRSISSVINSYISSRIWTFLQFSKLSEHATSSWIYFGKYWCRFIILLFYFFITIFIIFLLFFRLSADCRLSFAVRILILQSPVYRSRLCHFVTRSFEIRLKFWAPKASFWRNLVVNNFFVNKSIFSQTKYVVNCFKLTPTYPENRGQIDFLVVAVTCFTIGSIRS